MTRHRVYLGLGSNMGDRRANIRQAYQEIERLIGAIVRQSDFFVSAPWGFQSEHHFVNTAILVLTTLSPRRLLAAVQLIERRLGKGREHATERMAAPEGQSPTVVYHDRPIDIDILLYDDLTVCEPDLVIPHPLMYERDFVMQPLRQILAQTC